jgi:hypothetical protein
MNISNWICPFCREICNCSLCLVEPTGQLVYIAKKNGYKSGLEFGNHLILVHHLLLENQLSEIRLGIILKKEIIPVTENEEFDVFVEIGEDGDIVVELKKKIIPL